MILYLDRREVPDVEDLPADVLRWCIRKAEVANGRYGRLMRYYRGDHDIFHRAGEQDEVRVAVNYAKYVVDIALGYYLGQGVKYDANPRSWREGGETLTAAPRLDLTPLLSCYDRQHISRIDREIGRTMGIMGDCLELCYASNEADPKPKSAPITPETAFWSATARWSTTSSLPSSGTGRRPPAASGIMPSPATPTAPEGTTGAAIWKRRCFIPWALPWITTSALFPSSPTRTTPSGRGTLSRSSA